PLEATVGGRARDRSAGGAVRSTLEWRFDGGHANLAELTCMCHDTARVAELADALASGASVRKDVGVQVPPRAQRGRPSDHGPGAVSFAGKLVSRVQAEVSTCALTAGAP